jgi:hypothetical protein
VGAAYTAHPYAKKSLPPLLRNTPIDVEKAKTSTAHTCLFHK